MKRSSPDLETAIAYSCTRVSKIDEDDWKKLRRVIVFIQCSIEDIRIIGADDLTKIFTWTNETYAVNPDMKGKTGGPYQWGLAYYTSKMENRN